MRKIVCVLLVMALMLTLMTACAQSPETIEQDATSIDTYEDYRTLDNVLTMKMSEVDSVEDFDSLREFMSDGGIIVVENDSSSEMSICDELDIPFQSEIFVSNTEKENENSNDDLGVDLATIYYNYANGLDGVYIINVQSDSELIDKDNLINEAVNEITTIQNGDVISTIQPLSTSVKSSVIGSLTINTISFPKGKLKAIYNFFTEQDYLGQDFYTVKATVTGYPGAYLYSSNSNYNSKYKGLSIGTKIETATDSVTVDSFGPYSMDNTTSYSVDVGGSLNTDISDTLNAEFNYEKNTSEMSIDASSTPKLAEWNTSLKSDSRKESITFVPAVTFSCPDTKKSVDISLYSNYVLDSWNTSSEKISISRAVTCTPENVK